MSTGLFLGKFMPPHNGHLFVCDVARRLVDDLTIFVCSCDAEPIDGNLRAGWMRQTAGQPGCNIVHMHRDIPQEPKDHPDFWQIWKDAVFEHHPQPIDFVFGSENYIYKLAAILDAKPFVVDPDRQTVPVSGTGIRNNPAQNWAHIPRPVRPYFQTKVTLLGPESSGKSTLAALLADHFDTKRIPEYGRDYDATFKQGANWTADDFLNIAKGQLALATAIAANAGPMVVEDTDLLQTIVWSETLLGVAPPALVEQLKQAKQPDLYLLLGPEMQWVDDGTRYHPSHKERQFFHTRLQHWLAVIGAAWHEISGATWNLRQHQALQATGKVSKPERPR